MQQFTTPKSNLSAAIACLLIFLFVYTAASKLFDWPLFNAMLHKSPLIGDKSAYVASIIPFTELVLAGLLLFPATRLKGLCASLAVLVVFTMYIGYMLAFVPHLPCSCGGVIKYMTWHQHVVFNLSFILLAIIGIVAEVKALHAAVNPAVQPYY